jgi:fucose 4-O-acetylase-like acetyltransferase
MKQRIDYIDLTKGICILMIVVVHISDPDKPISDAYAYTMLSSFVMPLYYLLSGMFFAKYSGLANFTLRKFNKLIVPFAFFLLMSYLFYCIGWAIRGHSDMIPDELRKSISHPEYLYFNTPVWFFASLFEVSLMFYLVVAVCDKLKIKEWGKKAVMPILSFSIGIIGYVLGIYRINLPFWFDTSLTALPFYYTGYFLSKETNFLVPNKLDKYIPLFLVAFALGLYFLADRKEMILNLYHKDYFSFYISGMCGILFMILLSKLIGKLPIISYIGRYSGIILGTHWVVLWILRRYLYFITDEMLMYITYFSLVVIISVPLIKFFLRFFPRLVGEKDLIRVN